jgi:hypothetical protein
MTRKTCKVTYCDFEGCEKIKEFEQADYGLDWVQKSNA